MSIETYKETDLSGFFIGSKGTVINQTGIKLVKYRQADDTYVGLEINGRRIMKKLSHLVYQFHINRGQKINEELTVIYMDGDKSNTSTSNLTLRPKKNTVNIDYYKPRQGKQNETTLYPITLHPIFMQLRAN